MVSEDKKSYIPFRENHTVRRKGEKDEQEVILTSSKIVAILFSHKYCFPNTIFTSSNSKRIFELI